MANWTSPTVDGSKTTRQSVTMTIFSISTLSEWTGCMKSSATSIASDGPLTHSGTAILKSHLNICLDFSFKVFNESMTGTFTSTNPNLCWNFTGSQYRTQTGKSTEVCWTICDTFYMKSTICEEFLSTRLPSISKALKKPWHPCTTRTSSSAF